MNSYPSARCSEITGFNRSYSGVLGRTRAHSGVLGRTRIRLGVLGRIGTRLGVLRHYRAHSGLLVRTRACPLCLDDFQQQFSTMSKVGYTHILSVYADHYFKTQLTEARVWSESRARRILTHVGSRWEGGVGGGGGFTCANG